MSSWDVYSADKNAREKNKSSKNLSDVEKEGANLWVNPYVNSSHEDEEKMVLNSPQDSIDKSEDFKVKSFNLNWSGVSCISINCVCIYVCMYILRLHSTLDPNFGIA